jgi:hypothetical protein
MRQLQPISRLSNQEKLIGDVPVKGRQTGHQLAPTLEIEAVQEVKNDPGRLLQMTAPATLPALNQISIGGCELPEQ